MDNISISSALGMAGLGACITSIITALAAIIVVWRQNRTHIRLKKLDIALNSALAEYGLQIELIKSRPDLSQGVNPISIYLMHYLDVIKLTDKKTLKECDFEDLSKKNKNLTLWYQKHLSKPSKD